MPSDLNFKECSILVHSPDDAHTEEFLRFPAEYEGPVRTPSAMIHPSANTYLTHVAVYITKELDNVAMLGPFNHPPFAPQCQTNPPFTRPKKDSSDHHGPLLATSPSSHNQPHLNTRSWGEKNASAFRLRSGWSYMVSGQGSLSVFLRHHHGIQTASPGPCCLARGLL